MFFLRVIFWLLAVDLCLWWSQPGGRVIEMTRSTLVCSTVKKKLECATVVLVFRILGLYFVTGLYGTFRVVLYMPVKAVRCIFVLE